MRKIKILHGADLHLDSPFEGLPAGKAAVRRSEQRELLGRLAALVQSESVDLVLLSGDLLDSGKPYFETGEELIRYDLGEDFSIETAVVVGELYKHNGAWKFNAIGSGFQGGLAALCGHYGIQVA